MYDSDVNFYVKVATWARCFSNHDICHVGLCMIMHGNFYLSCADVRKVR
jgi:hypothetical protein